MRLDLADDPAVIGIARITHISEDAVVGKLFRLWAWANRNLENGSSDVTDEWCNRYVQCNDFAEAMEEYGWLKIDVARRISFPKFDRWNSEGAKNRLKRNRIQARRRSRIEAELKPKSGLKPASKRATREEKRREEKKEDNKNPPAAVPVPTTEALAAPQRPSSLHAEAIAAFTSRWELRYRETYPFAAGKDGAAAKSLLARCGGDVAKFTAAVERYLADPDPFYAGHGLAKMQTGLERWITPNAALGAKNGSADKRTYGQRLDDVQAENINKIMSIPYNPTGGLP